MPTREGQYLLPRCYPYYTDARISEIVRAAKILKEMQRAHEAEMGAIGMDGQMIDAPMIKQVIVGPSLLFSVLKPMNSRRRKLLTLPELLV